MTVFVALGVTHPIDVAALDVAQRARSAVADVVASFIVLFGRAEVAGGLALGIAVARLRGSPRDALVPLFIVATIAVEAALKILVPEAAPPHDRARTIGLVPLAHTPFVYAFPSGNVARFAFLLGIVHRLPRWLLLAGIMAMAASSMYLAEHWLFDTIGGALLGLLVADLARSFVRR